MTVVSGASRDMRGVRTSVSIILRVRLLGGSLSCVALWGAGVDVFSIMADLLRVLVVLRLSLLKRLPNPLLPPNGEIEPPSGLGVGLGSFFHKPGLSASFIRLLGDTPRDLWDPTESTDKVDSV